MDFGRTYDGRTDSQAGIEWNINNTNNLKVNNIV